MKKRFDSVRNVIVLEKCIALKKLIQILFINDFEVIQDIIVKDIASTIKPLVNPKEVVPIVKVNTL